MSVSESSFSKSSSSTIAVATLGTPRIGPRRELKVALERFWSGASDEKALIETAAGLRAANWARQKKLGVTVIPSNDFSFYDRARYQRHGRRHSRDLRLESRRGFARDLFRDGARLAKSGA